MVIRNEYPEQRNRKDHQHKCGEAAPDNDHTDGCPIPLTDALHPARAEVLCDKCVDRRGKSLRRGIGDGLDLRTDLLSRDSGVPPARDEPGEDHGEAGEKHALDGDRQTDFQNLRPGPPLTGLEYMDLRKNGHLAAGCQKEHGCYDGLGQNGGCGGSGHAHLREWADPKDHKRVQNDVQYQSCAADKERDFTAPCRIINSGESSGKENKRQSGRNNP